MCTIGKSRMSDEEEAKISPSSQECEPQAHCLPCEEADDIRLKQLLNHEHIALYDFL